MARASKAVAKVSDKNLTTKPVGELKKPPVDKMEVGYHFPYGPDHKTPKDYLFEWKDSHWKQGGQLVSGWKLTDLTDGIDLKTMHLPPLATWLDGFWFASLALELDEDVKPAWVDNLITMPSDSMIKALTAKEQGMSLQFSSAWNTWCVSGEGMPGAWAYYCYTLPDDQAMTDPPKHPAMWPEDAKAWRGKGPKMTTYQSNQPSWWAKTETKPLAPKAPVAPSMPTGLRIRCPGCGHWFKESDLAGHVTWACAGSEDATGDFAIMCVAECGCRTLDEAAKCKEGFPRPKKPVTSDAPKEEVASESSGSGD